MWRLRQDFRATARRLVYRFLPDAATLALKVSADGLRFSRLLRIFSRDLRQISSTLNDDLLDLFGRSEHVLTNRLTFFNLSEEFGAEIDWERHVSPAWRAELHSFDYALDLALTYRISGEERYARHLRYILAEWISANPPGQGSGWNVRALARRIRNWILAADLARDDWERDPTFLSLVTESLALQTIYLAQQIESDSSGADGLDAARALHFAGRFFAGTRAAEFASSATNLLRRELEGNCRATQQCPQLRLALTLMDFVLTLSDDDDTQNAWVRPALFEGLQTLEGMLLPDGTLPLFGPTAEPAPDTLCDLYALAAVLFEDPRWKSLAGHFGILPYMLLGERGQSIFAGLPDSPWRVTHSVHPRGSVVRVMGGDASALLVKSASGDSPCSHQDFLSYELFMSGQRAIVDSGAFSPEGESWDPYFARPQAHNVLLVDGQGPRAASLSSSLSAAALRYGLNSSGLCLANAGFRFAGLDHRRAWYCLDKRCWAVVDRIEGSGVHRYTSLVHFYPTFTVDLGEGRAIVHSRSLTLTLVPLGADVTLSTFRGPHAMFPSWYSPEFGLRYEAATLQLEWESARQPWMGGFVLIPGTARDLSGVEIDSAAGVVRFELFGKQYRLEMSWLP